MQVQSLLLETQHNNKWENTQETGKIETRQRRTPGEKGCGLPLNEEHGKEAVKSLT